MNPLIEVKNLSKTFRVRRSGEKEKVVCALNDVSFQLEKGDRLGVLGSSGSGKTTLLKLILGLIAPTSGCIIKNTQAGFVAQDPYASLCHALTVDKIIAEPLLFLKKYRQVSHCQQEVREAMSWVNLDYDTYAPRYPHQLSGGERQRVSIARALICRPGFLALDEPTSMVDYEVKSGITEVILSAAEAAGSALLLVTHDIALAKELCDKLLILHHGELIEYATTHEILVHPQHEHTKRLVLAGTDLEEYWASMSSHTVEDS